MEIGVEDKTLFDCFRLDNAREVIMNPTETDPNNSLRVYMRSNTKN
jgi:hypothetical protein